MSLAARGARAPAEQFFIISSVDARKKQLLLKFPTEVTEVMLVTSKTVYLDEDGHPIHFQDLRAGDTVYITSTRDAQRDIVALRIRQGPMTVEQLHRRYLPGVTSE